MDVLVIIKQRAFLLDLTANNIQLCLPLKGLPPIPFGDSFIKIIQISKIREICHRLAMYFSILMQ